ncbi:MAG: glycosyltransferase family 4 protein [Kiritimatiellae bacterium]|nr:glycosyltransferase family 4 protein [Kiritimatiellia bacterium]
MNILLINQYYPPDVAPTGQYLHDLARRLIARGHTVTVLASRSSYNGDVRYGARETIDGIDVRRVGGLNFGRGNLLLKAVEYGWFLARLAVRLRRMRPAADFVLCLTTPPFVGAVARACRRRQSAYGHWIMDLYPDVLFAHDMVKPGSWTARRLAALASYTIGGGAFAVGLGPDMAARLRPYAGSAQVESIPLWPLTVPEPDDVAVQALRYERGWKETDTVFMYSGNMGLGHRFSEFLATVEATASNPAVRWVFAGGGKRRPEMEAFAAAHPEARLELLPYAPPDQLAAHQLSGDVHLMSLDNRWKGCMIPSKVQAICQLGRPIIFVGGRDSSPAQWIMAYEAGWVVDEMDTAALKDAVESALDPEERAHRGAGARRLAEAAFGAESNANRLCDLIETCIPSSHLKSS